MEMTVIQKTYKSSYRLRTFHQTKKYIIYMLGHMDKREHVLISSINNVDTSLMSYDEINLLLTLMPEV